MKIQIVGRQMNVWDEMKETIAKKISKLDRYFENDTPATVTLSSKHGKKCIEITISSAGVLFRSEVEDETFRTSLDRAVAAIDRQIRKNKTRLSRRIRENAFDAVGDTLDEYEEEKELIIREKEFAYKPMSPEEAILQMNLIGHSFFVFRSDSDPDKVLVVYKRNDGSYGLIRPVG